MRAKLIVALFGLGLLVAAGCGEPAKPAGDKEKSSTPTDPKGAKPAEGSGK